MPLIPCRFAVLGESLFGTNDVYAANYNMICMSFFVTSILSCKLRHILAVRNAPNRLYCKLQYEMRAFFATSILPCKLRHILAMRGAPNRVAGAPPSPRRRVAGASNRGATAAMPLVLCRSAIRGLFWAAPC